MGQVSSYQLSVSLSLFINPPYDQLVKPDSRFWNASGMDISVDSNGFRLRTQTVTAVMAGGIAFATPDDSPSATPVSATPRYILAKDQESTLTAPDGPALSFRLRFDALCTVWKSAQQ